METVTIPLNQFKQMKQEIIFLRTSPIYKRLLEFEKNILQDKKYTRKDLRF